MYSASDFWPSNFTECTSFDSDPSIWWAKRQGHKTEYSRTRILTTFLVLSNTGSNPKLRQICNLNLQMEKKYVCHMELSKIHGTHAVESKSWSDATSLSSNARSSSRKRRSSASLLASSPSPSLIAFPNPMRVSSSSFINRACSCSVATLAGRADEILACSSCLDNAVWY